MQCFCLCWGELILAYAAEGAYPIFRQIFEGGSGLDAIVGIAKFGIINISANIAYILFHIITSIY